MEPTDAPIADLDEDAQAALERELEDEESEPGFIVMRGYRAHEPSPRLLGNQMAMSLPKPVSDQRVINVIGDPPLPRPANLSSMPLSARTEYLAQIQFFHHVFQVHIDFVHKVIAVVRASFLFRDPRSRDVMAFIWSLVSGAVGTLPRLSGTGGGGGLGILLVGPSGVGKTSIVDRIVAYLRPKARIHLSLGGRPARWMQLGVVRIVVGNTWHETLMSILAEADRQMQMDRYVREGRLVRRGELQGLVWRTLTSHFCPLLVLDEFQMLGRLQSDEALKILKGLVELMEQLGIPVLVVGTEAVRNLFASFPNYMEKFSNEGLTEFSVLLPEDPTSVDIHEDAQVLLDTYKALHVSPVEPRYSEDYDYQFMLHTMGIPRVMREYKKVLFREHANAWENGHDLILDKGLLERLAQGPMKIYEPSLDVLRKHRLGYPLRFEDWRTYENSLPPEAELTEAQKQLYFEWHTTGNVNRPMPASVFEEMRVKLVALGLAEAATPRDSNGATGEQAAVPQAGPKTALTAPPKKAAPATGGTSPKPRGKKSNSPGDLLESLKKSKVRSIATARQEKTGEGPPTLSVDDIR